MTYSINTAITAAVSNDVYWIPIDSNTPLRVKIWLIHKASGVATMGEYRKCDHFDHWHPMPRFKIEYQVLNEDDGEI